jgi:hypothetical protein
MKIKNGFNNKETEIRINSQSNGTIELWICESGRYDKETLSYLTADELVALFNEVKNAGRDLF